MTLWFNLYDLPGVTRTDCGDMSHFHISLLFCKKRLVLYGFEVWYVTPG
jgi:hypothetical protein